MKSNNYLNKLLCFLLIVILSNCAKQKNQSNLIVDSQKEIESQVPEQILNDLSPSLIKSGATTVILVRHAEDFEVGADPELIDTGKKRAALLSNILKDIPLTAVLSTNYNRTKQTAWPTAVDQGLEVISYSASDLQDVADHILQNYPNQTVLVVGHSNTTPSLANILAGSDFEMINEDTFNNLFVISTTSVGNGKATHLTYGR